ncbi:nitrile hydratase subunit alpha [Mycolicibacterium hodleri]|uniref:Nitrile hydratase alpha/Thiocyanate hydrolase gamma domain-containing protein n=1 Tax=Mycolicibacterium hodleri TaxID=49897 RepID=A0A502EGM1_9MYCO|nr:nitrile hydratase subunit alpha [Mycolicibacterium hodleri]TPG36873.1 hypothetical protein EAH80_02920 [Mycolicibacterium hodleri]
MDLGAVLGSRDGQAEPTLTEDDKALRQWFNSNVLQDSRCNSKLILKLAASAMHSDEFRARLVDHTDEVLAEVGHSSPGGVGLKFLDNTPQTLHVILPTRPENRPPELRELLHSRTSIATFSTVDDWDFGDLGTGDTNSGDEGLDGHPVKTMTV